MMTNHLNPYEFEKNGHEVEYAMSYRATNTLSATLATTSTYNANKHLIEYLGGFFFGLQKYDYSSIIYSFVSNNVRNIEN